MSRTVDPYRDLFRATQRGLEIEPDVAGERRLWRLRFPGGGRSVIVEDDDGAPALDNRALAHLYAFLAEDRPDHPYRVG